MAKVSKHFELIIPFIRMHKVYGKTTITHLCDLTVTGVGYFFPEDTDDDMFDFDIDQVFFEKQDIKPALDAVSGGSVRYEPQIFQPLEAHMQFLFADELKMVAA